MNTTTTIVGVSAASILRSEGETLVLSKSAKTGAGAISIEKQKAWVDRYMAVNPEAKRNAAKREYMKYRVERAHDFSARIGALITEGKVLVNRASVSKGGNLRGVSFMTPRDANTVKVADAGYEFGKAHGLTAEQTETLVQLAKKVKAAEADDTIEGAVTEVKETETAGQAVGAAA